jgi:hypothetical protein
VHNTYTYKPTPVKEVTRMAAEDSFDLCSDFLNPEVFVQYDKADVQFDYRVREKEIDNSDAVNGKVYSNSMGANLYPSMWVRTDLLGQQVWGQIVTMPDEFPGGNYIIRAVLAQKGQPLDAVFLRRSVYELEWSSSPSEDDIHEQLLESNAMFSADNF